MKSFNFFGTLLIFLNINLGLSQNFKQIPDTLKKYNFKELKTKIYYDISNTKNLYSKTYLLKAKKENNVSEIINGYYYMGIKTNNYNDNLKYSDSAIVLIKKEKPEILSLFYFYRGDIYYTEKRLKEALDYYLLANESVDKI